MITVLLAVAGGLGAVTRFWLDSWVARHNRTGFPLGTVIINVTGSLVLGLLTGLAAGHAGMGDLRTVLGTGFLGGYTTFSTASVEAVRLALSGRYRAAVAHAAGMLATALAAALLGIYVGTLVGTLF